MHSDPVITTNYARLNFQNQDPNYNHNRNQPHTLSQHRLQNQMVAVNRNAVSNATANVSSPTNSNNKKISETRIRSSD